MQNKKKEELINEINILKVIDHINLLNIKEFYETDKYYHFVSEYYSGGALESKVQQFTYNQAKAIVKQILNGLRHIHQLGIMHRDLKPDNIIFKNNKSLDISIVDFGLS